MTDLLASSGTGVWCDRSLLCLSRSIMVNTWEWPPACLTVKYRTQAANNSFPAVGKRRSWENAAWLRVCDLLPSLALLGTDGYKWLVFWFSRPIKRREKVQKKVSREELWPSSSIQGEHIHWPCFGAIAIKTDLWPQIYRLYLRCMDCKCLGQNAMSWNILQEDMWCSNLDSHRPVTPAGHFIMAQMAKYHNYYNLSYSNWTCGTCFFG